MRRNRKQPHEVKPNSRRVSSALNTLIDYEEQIRQANPNLQYGALHEVCEALRNLYDAR